MTQEQFIEYPITQGLEDSQEIRLDSLTLPISVTYEELAFLEIVKENMLRKLDDRRKFIFVYCIEQGHDQRSAARILGLHETNVSRHLKRIREILLPFKKTM